MTTLLAGARTPFGQWPRKQSCYTLSAFSSGISQLTSGGLCAKKKGDGSIYTPTSKIADIVGLHESVRLRLMLLRELEDICGPQNCNCLLDARRTPNMTPIHFCFVLHGLQGRPTDLSYMHDAIKSKSKENGMFVRGKSSDWKVGAKATATGNHANKRVQSLGRNEITYLHQNPFKKKNGIIDNLEDKLSLKVLSLWRKRKDRITSLCLMPPAIRERHLMESSKEGKGWSMKCYPLSDLRLCGKKIRCSRRENLSKVTQTLQHPSSAIVWVAFMADMPLHT